MTPNDKILPEEITNKIKAEATAAYADIPVFVAYTKGATAWAGWKVRFDELQAQTNLSLAIQRRCTTAAQEGHERMIKERNKCQEQTQRMADALVKVKSKLNWIENADEIGIICEALQQFKDGTKGKEVGDEPKPEGWPWVCEFCGKQDCGSDHK